jgi:quinol monooxygenase YgiN
MRHDRYVKRHARLAQASQFSAKEMILMVAFAVTWQVVPGQLGRLLARAPQLLRSLQQQHGFQSLSVYVNREEGTLLTISQWASREDLEADQPHHEQSVKALASVATVNEAKAYEPVNFNT